MNKSTTEITTRLFPFTAENADLRQLAQLFSVKRGFGNKEAEDKVLTSPPTGMVYNNNTITILADGSAVTGYLSLLMACATFNPLIMGWQVLRMLFL